MPFKSMRQMRYMFANMPKMAKEWASETPKGRKLPNKVKKHVEKHGLTKNYK